MFLVFYILYHHQLSAHLQPPLFFSPQLLTSHPMDGDVETQHSSETALFDCRHHCDTITLYLVSTVTFVKQFKSFSISLFISKHRPPPWPISFMFSIHGGQSNLSETRLQGGSMGTWEVQMSGDRESSCCLSSPVDPPPLPQQTASTATVWVHHFIWPDDRPRRKLTALGGQKRAQHSASHHHIPGGT